MGFGSRACTRATRSSRRIRATRSGTRATRARLARPGARPRATGARTRVTGMRWHVFRTNRGDVRQRLRRGDMRRNAVLAGWGALLFATSGCAEDAQIPIAETIGSEPTLPAPTVSQIPTIQIAPAVGWRDGASPRRGAGPRRAAVREGARSPALALRAPQRGRARRRDECAGTPRRRQRNPGMGHGPRDETRGRGRAEPEPDHVAARRGRRRRRRGQDAVHRRTALAVRHGARGPRSVCRQYRQYPARFNTCRARRS